MLDYANLESADVVTRSMLERHAAAWPDEILVSFEDGLTWTRRQALEEAYGVGNDLSSRGIKRGDRVLVMLPNGADFLRVWWGVAAIGAILVPTHTGFRGAMLEHLLRLAQPAAVIASAEYQEAFATVDPALLPPVQLTPVELSGNDRAPPPLDRPIEFWEPAVYMLTSGTTGPSRLVSGTYVYGVRGGNGLIMAAEADRSDNFLVDIPLFHGAAYRFVSACLYSGTRLTVRSAPSLSNYWQIIRDGKVTLSVLMSTMVPFIMAQPVRENDRDHTLRAVLAGPLPRNTQEFKDRFGIAEVFTGMGQTEVPGPLAGHPDDEPVFGYVGRICPDYQGRIVDENDLEVPHGTVGQLVLRTDFPWLITSEYVRNPAETARAWRNGWFHTGDGMRRDEVGRYFFVDRVKDALRRRGENISSAEVEAEVLRFGGIAEAACVACASDQGIDDEVKVWIVAEQGKAPDFEALMYHCLERMPYFMVPRYFEVTSEFAKTPSLRVKKMELRQRGNGPDVWDREAHGFFVTRRGLEIRNPAARATVAHGAGE